MSIEHISHREKEIKKIDEEQEKEKIRKQLEHSKEKKKLINIIDTSKDISFLKSLIERWLISVDVANTIIEWIEFDSEQIKEIFEKIDEIEHVKDVEKLLPKELRITKEEYITALWNENYRKATITKLNWALDYIYHTTHPFNSSFINLSYIIVLLNQNLSKIHSNTIDIKRDLEKIDNISENKSIWKQTVDFFKDIF